MTTQTLKILVAEDDTFGRDGIVKNLQNIGLDTQIFEAKNGVEALKIARKQEIDIVFADINMQPMTGLELCEHLRKEKPDTKLCIITGHISPNYIAQMNKLSVDGMIHKIDANRTDIKSAVSTILDGGQYLSANFLKFSEEVLKLSKAKDTTLTDREQKAVELLAGGKPITQLGPEIGMCKRDVYNLFGKLRDQFGVKKNIQLISKLHELHLI